MYHLDLPDAGPCTHDGLTCLYHESTWGAFHCSVLLPLFFGLSPLSNWALGCMGPQWHHITSFLNCYHYVLVIAFLQKQRLDKFCCSLHRKQLKMKTQMISFNNLSSYNVLDTLFLFCCHVAFKRKDLPPLSSQLKISRWKYTGHAR